MRYSMLSFFIISQLEVTLCLTVMNVVAFRAIESIVATIDVHKAYWKSLSYRGRLKNRAGYFSALFLFPINRMVSLSSA